MTQQRRKAGWYKHVHHGADPIEWCWDEDERQKAIERKPASEQPLRKKFFQPLQDTSMIPPALDKAEASFYEAGATYDKALATYDKARATYYKAEATYDEARAAARPVLLEIHKAQCFPDCPWDGQTIFSKR